MKSSGLLASTELYLARRDPAPFRTSMRALELKREAGRTWGSAPPVITVVSKVEFYTECATFVSGTCMLSKEVWPAGISTYLKKLDKGWKMRVGPQNQLQHHSRGLNVQSLLQWFCKQNSDRDERFWVLLSNTTLSSCGDMDGWHGNTQSSWCHCSDCHANKVLRSLGTNRLTSGHTSTVNR